MISCSIASWINWKLTCHDTLMFTTFSRRIFIFIFHLEHSRIAIYFILHSFICYIDLISPALHNRKEALSFSICLFICQFAFIFLFFLYVYFSFFFSIYNLPFYIHLLSLYPSNHLSSYFCVWMLVCQAACLTVSVCQSGSPSPSLPLLY